MRKGLKAARAELHELQAKHGGLLFRAAGGRNTKLWIEPTKLLELRPALAQREHLGDVLTRLDAVEQQLADLVEFRRKANAWLSKVGPK